MERNQSFFDGGLLGLVVNSIGAFFLTILTLGIAYPWALCMKERWICRHTVIEGRRLCFTGSGLGLFGTWIKIFLLSLITLGIYAFWAGIAVKKWKVRHMVFEG